MNTGTSKTKQIIPASELAGFAFCPHAWRLQYVLKIRPDQARLTEGAAAHKAHATQVFASRQRLVTATVLALLALTGLAGAWLLLGGQP